MDPYRDLNVQTIFSFCTNLQQAQHLKKTLIMLQPEISSDIDIMLGRLKTKFENFARPTLIWCSICTKSFGYSQHMLIKVSVKLAGRFNCTSKDVGMQPWGAELLHTCKNTCMDGCRTQTKILSHAHDSLVLKNCALAWPSYEQEHFACCTMSTSSCSYKVILLLHLGTTSKQSNKTLWLKHKSPAIVKGFW